MSSSDIVEVQQQEQISEQNYVMLFDRLGDVKPLDPLSGSPQPDISDQHYLFYQAPMAPDSQQDMLSDYPPEELLQECLISNITPQTGEDNQDSLFMLPESPQLETPEEVKKNKNSTNKNILGYETKKVIKLMFSKHGNYLSRKCKEEGIGYRQFKRYYSSMEKKLYGPVSLNKMFRVDPKNEKEKRMKGFFLRVFTKILRKEYIIYSLKVGKMQDLDPYIQKKNSLLLYYAGCEEMLSNESS